MSVYQIVRYHGSDPALTPYKNLIYTSFMKSLRFGNDWFKDIDSDSYFKTYHQVIDALLHRPYAQVSLALLTEDLDTCVGWSLSEDKTLHYVFVKGDIQARRHGIAKDLIPKDFDTITHLTKIGRSIWKEKYPNVSFNPFL